MADPDHHGEWRGLTGSQSLHESTSDIDTGVRKLSVAQFLMLENAIEQCGLVKLLARGISIPLIEQLIAGGYCVPDGKKFVLTLLAEAFVEHARFDQTSTQYWLDGFQAARWTVPVQGPNAVRCVPISCCN